MNRELTACGFCRNDFQVVDTEAPFGASDIIKGHRPSQVPADIDLLKFVARVEGQRGTDPAKCPDPYAELQCCVNTKVKGGQTVYERSQGGALAGDWPPTLTWVGETVRFINLSFSQLQVAAVFLNLAGKTVKDLTVHLLSYHALYPHQIAEAVKGRLHDSTQKVLDRDSVVLTVTKEDVVEKLMSGAQTITFGGGETVVCQLAKNEQLTVIGDHECLTVDEAGFLQWNADEVGSGGQRLTRWRTRCERTG
ncbi:hypothetical protein CYMTET_14186 [Cymbomonas tetramitiformis]|uniref:Uncharacterized protein n=1 Tax=Cymbomonas tetramitiformis TaxID=36881 RepID=A0AAE0LAM2_9CHLO|nr:hypothetical protein CYMTET_14186 [Cymbomonas tetramitiformis]